MKLDFSDNCDNDTLLDLFNVFISHGYNVNVTLKTGEDFDAKICGTPEEMFGLQVVEVDKDCERVGDPFELDFEDIDRILVY